MDFSSQDDPFKKSVSVTSIGNFDPGNKVEVTIPLALHEVELADDIYDPLGFGVEGFQYISATKQSEITISEKSIPRKSPDLMSVEI